MRYYLHVHERETVIEDVEGIELASTADAVEEARESARELAADMVRRQQAVDRTTLELTDADGKSLIAIPLMSVIING